MKRLIAVIAVVVAVVAAAKAVSMLPPDVFKDPIFASEDSDSDSGSEREHTDFA